MWQCQDGHFWIGNGSGRSRFDLRRKNVHMHRYHEYLEHQAQGKGKKCINAGYQQTQMLLTATCFTSPIQLQSQKIKIIQLLAIPHDIALDLAGVDPGHKVLHIAAHQKSRVIDNLSPNADMTLFNKCSSLSMVSLQFKNRTPRHFRRMKLTA